MGWKMKRRPQDPGELDDLIARLHPLVFTVQSRLRANGHPLDTMDVLRECLSCLEAASSHAFGMGWPTTDTTEFYGTGPDADNGDVVHEFTAMIREAGPPALFTQAAARMTHDPSGWDDDPAVTRVGQRCTAIAKALCQCLGVPTKA